MHQIYEGDKVLRLNILALLEKHKKSKYWLWKQLGMSYQGFSSMVNNETASISYRNIETLCVIFGVTPNELFEYDFDTEENK